MGNKERLKELLINGNNFGESGKVLLKKELEKGSKLESLGTLRYVHFFKIDCKLENNF